MAYPAVENGTQANVGAQEGNRVREMVVVVAWSLHINTGTRMKTLASYGFFVLFATVFSAFADSPIVPNPKLTPGDVLTTDVATICTPGYTKTVRDVPENIKNQAYLSYGITSRQPREYEIDHLISLELGGSNSILNLWPESYITQPLNAHTKDKMVPWKKKQRLHPLNKRLFKR